jgi:hypothetical protein
MKTSKEFFEELREGDEYLSCMMTKEVYNGIDLENRERIVVNTVRQKNSKFKNDEVHKALVKKVTKVNKELRDYEFENNHK